MTRTADAIVCGAGIAGTAAAFHLAVRHKVERVIVIDEREPMTLTSDKGTQGYRNWWPGPDATMLKMVSRSIAFMEEIAVESDNVMRMSRRGYLFVTARHQRLRELEATARQVSDFGMGPLRIHPGSTKYRSARAEGFEDSPIGADSMDAELVKRVFPALAPDVVGALHIRHAGWLSAVAMGQHCLMTAMAHGASFVRDTVTEVIKDQGRVRGVKLASGEEIHSDKVLLAAGPLLHRLLPGLGVEIPLIHELHGKVTFNDVHRVVPRDSPFLIWTDPVQLDWSAEERKHIVAAGESHLLGEMPGGVHVRPFDGPHGDELYLIWTYENSPRTVEWPPLFSPWYARAVMRSVCAMIPGMDAYRQSGDEGFVDGGYYCKTPENRPLAGALPLEGAFVCGALSGSGLMAAHGLAEMATAAMLNEEAPEYAHLFAPARYSDPEYQKLMQGWGPGVGQL